MTGHGLEQAIRNEFSGDIMDGLMAILQCTSNKAEFFASRLKKSMAGIGTNDQQLIRVIVTRCEIDLNDIKAAFERLYGKALRSWIKVSAPRAPIKPNTALTKLHSFHRVTPRAITSTPCTLSLANRDPRKRLRALHGRASPK